jgi:DNA polymerase (family 10)
VNGEGQGIRVLRSLEMNLRPDGRGDMEPAALARLDLVLGAFHSALRRTDDQSARYLAALRHGHFHILAHPRGRIWNFRLGLTADWPRMFARAAALDKAVEIDAYADRQDIDPSLLADARREGVRISIGSDAHSPGELAMIDLGLASALGAGIPRERILELHGRRRHRRVGGLGSGADLHLTAGSDPAPVRSKRQRRIFPQPKCPPAGDGNGLWRCRS